jgi:hypothetical protein
MTRSTRHRTARARRRPADRIRLTGSGRGQRTELPPTTRADRAAERL